MSSSDKIRIAVVNQQKCKPTKCHQECKKICPVENMGIECVNVTKTSKSVQIVEENCNGCGMCTKKCPHDALTIIQLPKSIANEKMHRYSNNGFILHKLPTPKIGQVIGLIGANGIGKSTVLQILCGSIVPNNGIIGDEIILNDNVDIEDISKKQINDQIINWNQFNSMGKNKNKEKNKFIKKITNKTEIQDYFKKISDNNIKAIIKCQHIDDMINDVNVANVSVWKYIMDNNICVNVLNELEIMYLSDKSNSRTIKDLSGGELQRICIANTVSQTENYDVIIFDEPTSYLDIRQRMLVAKIIKKVAQNNKYVFVVDHDISIIDYMTDYIHILFGKSSTFGIVSDIHKTREGLNVYLDGFIPSENMRFRDEAINFKLRNPFDRIIENRGVHNYQAMTKTYGNLKINIKSDSYADSEITILCGSNGSGKTTFLKLLAGIEKPDGAENENIVNDVNISFKRQRLKINRIEKTSDGITISAKHNELKINPSNKNNVMTVEEYLTHKISQVLYHNVEFIQEVLSPLKINDIKNNNVNKLSGGELQRVCLAECLGNTSAQIYLIDEPSAFLDVEQRILISKMLRKYMYMHKKTAFIVEHDIMMCSYLADKMIVFQQNSSYDELVKNTSYVTTVTNSLSAEKGMDLFLRQMDVSLRYDVDSGRPRINKTGSNKDKNAKKLFNS